MPKPDFETYEHTADVGLIARGPTLEALFINAARGMMHIIRTGVGFRGPGSGRKEGDSEFLTPDTRQRFDVEVTAPDRAALLVAWLNELIFHFETRRLVLADFQIHDLTDERLAATVTGQAIGELDEPLAMELKAATYHGLRVEQTDAGWEAAVLFDV